MAVAVAVPDLGRDMAGVVVAEWYVADGARVVAGDAVCRVECGFVAVELEADQPGLLRHSKPAGSIERPGVVLAHIFAAGETPAAGLARPTQTDEAAETSEPAPAPEHARPEAEFEPEPEPVMLEEFEEALLEAVVVPFPRRFAQQPAVEWEPVPGDAVAFDSQLFESPDGPAEPLPVPGGSIPGLLLWEPEDERAGTAVYGAAMEERFERISAEVAASAQVLTMSVVLDATEARQMLSVCAREWRHAGVTPVLEDLVFRAVAMALHSHGAPAAAGGMLIAGDGSDVAVAVKAPAARPLLEAVEARCAGGDAGVERAEFVLVSVAAQGISSAMPRLDGGRGIAFAMGAPDSAGRLTLTAAYDSGAWSEGSAARMLARVRELFDAPYAMLV